MAAYVTIEVIGRRRSEELEAVVDTGFDGDVCLPIDIAIILGLELSGSEFVEYADGRVAHELLFDGEVRFLGRRLSVKN